MLESSLYDGAWIRDGDGVGKKCRESWMLLKCNLIA